MPDKINSVVIEIDGENYEEFKSGSVTRRFDSLCGSFDIKTTKDKMSEYNISPNDSCRIFVNGKKVLTGFVEIISPSEDADSSEVSLTGRCKTCDIVDSNLPVPINLSGTFTLVTVANKVIEALGIDCKVINEVPDLKSFTNADIISSEVDENAFDFLNKYAEKVSVLLITDADGNLVITRGGAGKKKKDDMFINEYDGENNNILSSSAGYDYTQRFNTYIFCSQANTNTTSSDTKIDINHISQKAVAIDDEIRPSRIFVKKTENSCSAEICKQMADLECNIRRANSLSYQNEIAGYEFNDGSLFDINTIAHVYDDDCEIDSELVIKSCTYNFGDGATTSLEFADVDAFTLQATMDSLTEKVSDTKSTKSKKKKKKKKKKKDATAETAELNKLLGLK